MGFEYYNANAKGRFVNDCVIRAISTAENKAWQDTYNELSEIAGQQGILLDDVNFVEPLLDSRYERSCEKRKTVGEFAEEHPAGTYLITMAGHITCLIDGQIVDTWDCRQRRMWCAWEIKNLS